MSTASERRHMGRVAQLTCGLCGAVGVEVHHIREGQGGAQRASDFLTVPPMSVMPPRAEGRPRRSLNAEDQEVDGARPVGGHAEEVGRMNGLRFKVGDKVRIAQSSVRCEPRKDRSIRVEGMVGTIATVVGTPSNPNRGFRLRGVWDTSIQLESGLVGMFPSLCLEAIEASTVVEEVEV